MTTASRCPSLFAALTVIIGLAGCSSSSSVPVTEVKGKVHQNGEPLSVPVLPSGAGGRVMVRLHALDQDEDSPGPYGAIVKPDGTFSIPGAMGRGIPPGKYRVEITWQDSFPMGMDKLDGKFGKENSPVIVEIPSDEDIDINVARYGK